MSPGAKKAMCPLSRRQILKAAVVAPAIGACGHGFDGGPRIGAEATADASSPPDAGEPEHNAGSRADADAAASLALAGVVIEIGHAGSVSAGQVQASAVRAMMTRGMTELTGKATEAEAWKVFFTADDVVGIKVNPFGYPNVYSQAATVGEIVRGLNLAGIPNTNIVVFDRYSDYLDQVGYPALLPADVRFAGVVPTTAEQTALAGYDPSAFVEMPIAEPGADANVAGNRRSHLCDLVSKEITKVVNVPVLKDHWTAGLTCALKNMTYGLVNNTARTHSELGNWTAEFIPAVAAMTKIRQKVVLHVADLLVACYDGGPDPSTKTFDYQSLLFAADPVALDRTAWSILDAERANQGLPAVGTLPGRQPDYVLRCGQAGLGIADLATIDRRVFAI